MSIRKSVVFLNKEIEDKIIELNKNKITYDEIVKITGVCKCSVYKVIKSNNLIVNKQKSFTKEEISFLIENYPSKGLEYCAKKLNRTQSSIQCKVNRGLKLKRPSPKIITKPGFKICTLCKQEKAFQEFQIRNEREDKYTNQCKKCVNLRNLPAKKIRRKLPLNKLEHNIRSRLKHALKLNNKSEKTFDLVGCSPKFLKEYLEKLFKVGMTWENYNYRTWHIDHIIPCMKFDLSKSEDQRKCFHYTNLRPLWATTEIARQHGDFETIGNLNRQKEKPQDISPTVYENTF